MVLQREKQSQSTRQKIGKHFKRVSQYLFVDTHQGSPGREAAVYTRWCKTFECGPVLRCPEERNTCHPDWGHPSRTLYHANLEMQDRGISLRLVSKWWQQWHTSALKAHFCAWKSLPVTLQSTGAGSQASAVESSKNTLWVTCVLVPSSSCISLREAGLAFWSHTKLMMKVSSLPIVRMENRVKWVQSGAEQYNLNTSLSRILHSDWSFKDLCIMILIYWSVFYKAVLVSSSCNNSNMIM